jgi:uncharacterized repeat protein (TIGR01451 family)
MQIKFYKKSYLLSVMLFIASISGVLLLNSNQSAGLVFNVKTDLLKINVARAAVCFHSSEERAAAVYAAQGDPAILAAIDATGNCCAAGTTACGTDNACTADCGSGAYLGTDCACHDYCTSPASWDGSSCVTTCPAGQEPWGNGCVATCPAGQGHTADGGCTPNFTCPAGQEVYSNTPPVCDTPCPSGQYHDSPTTCANFCTAPDTYVNGSCVSTCPTGQETYNGACVASCPSGTYRYDASTCKPFCNPPDTYVNGSCVSTCPTGQETYNGACVASCPSGTYRYDASTCKPFCGTGQTYQNGSCTCPSGQTVVGDQCKTNCPAGQEYDANGVCSTACAAGQARDPQTNACYNICPGNQQLTGGYCGCPSATVENPTTHNCIAVCPPGYCPNGAAQDQQGLCPCPNGQGQAQTAPYCPGDTTKTCPDGSVVASTASCTCPNGQAQSGSVPHCPTVPVDCPNGPDGTSTCPCPTGTWNPFSATCQGGDRVCPDGSTVPQGSACTCPNGQAQSGSVPHCPVPPPACQSGPDGTDACPCPTGTYWNDIIGFCRRVITYCPDGTVTPPNGSCPVYCNVSVSATTEGASVDPYGGYNYSITGGSNFSGSNSQTYYSVPANSNYTISSVSSPGGSSFDGNNTPATQYCASGSTINFGLNFSNPSTPLTVTATNTSQDSNVHCGTISVSWTAAAAVGGTYTVYRQTVDGSAGEAAIYTGTGLSLTDTPPVLSKSYAYRVQYSIGRGSNGTSNTVVATPCVVNLSTSDKVVAQVNGRSLPYNSACIGNQSGATKQFKAGDDLKMSINVCNTGTIEANNVIVVDDLSGENLTNLRNVSFQGGTSPSSSTSGNITTFNLGTIAAGFKGIITFDVDTVNPDRTKKNQLYRFRNLAKILFNSNATVATTGCIGNQANASQPCPVDTGYKVYINGSAPTTQEVNP